MNGWREGGMEEEREGGVEEAPLARNHGQAGSPFPLEVPSRRSVRKSLQTSPKWPPSWCAQQVTSFRGGAAPASCPPRHQVVAPDLPGLCPSRPVRGQVALPHPCALPWQTLPGAQSPLAATGRQEEDLA